MSSQQSPAAMPPPGSDATAENAPRQAADESRLVKRSIRLKGHRTSVALEPAFWRALDALAQAKGAAPATLIAQIDASRSDPAVSLASCLRVHLLAAARERRI